MALKADPDNTLYWHFPRRRMSAERIRDAMLVASGQLNDRMEGPGVRPPLPDALGTRESWKVTTDKPEQSRRSVYIFAKRNLPFPLLQAFDSPDMHESCARRASTTNAPQALFLLNSEESFQAAADFATRVTRETADVKAKPAPDGTPSFCPCVWKAYFIALGRMPHIGEASDAVKFLKAESEKFGREVALIDFCHALMNSNEFLFLE